MTFHAFDKSWFPCSVFDFGQPSRLARRVEGKFKGGAEEREEGNAVQEV
jgi:hypothetical protein